MPQNDQDKFYRTVITVEVLSEGPFHFGDLSDVHDAITTGDCSGNWEESSEEVSREKMRELLEAQNRKTPQTNQQSVSQAILEGLNAMRATYTVELETENPEEAKIFLDYALAEGILQSRKPEFQIHVEINKSKLNAPLMQLAELVKKAENQAWEPEELRYVLGMDTDSNSIEEILKEALEDDGDRSYYEEILDGPHWEENTKVELIVNYADLDGLLAEILQGDAKTLKQIVEEGRKIEENLSLKRVVQLTRCAYHAGYLQIIND